MDISIYELPACYNYILTSVTEEKSENGFNISFKCNLLTKEEVKAWMNEFQEIHKVQWRVSRTFPASGRYNAFKGTYRCQHGSPYKAKQSSNRSSKNTSCSASISVTIKRFGRDSKRSDEEKRHPCIVSLNNVHNHAVASGETLKYRDVSSETKQTIIELFHKGYSPSMAYHKLKNDLMELYQDDFFRVEKDRSIIPDMPYFYNLFYAEKRKEKVEKWKTYYKRENPQLMSEGSDRKGAKRKKTKGDEATSERCLEPETKKGESEGEWDSNGSAARSSLALTVERAEIIMANEETTLTSLENIYRTIMLSDVNGSLLQNDSFDRRLSPPKNSAYCKDLLESVKKQLCRVCGTKQDDLSPIYCEKDAAGGVALTVSRKILMYLPLQISKDEGLPTNICTKCLDLLESWHELHVSCLAADSVLRKIFGADECRDELDSQKGELRLEKENVPTENNVHERRHSSCTEKSFEFKNLLTVESYANGKRGEVRINENSYIRNQDVEVEENVVAIDNLLPERDDDDDDEISCDKVAISSSDNYLPQTEKDLPIYSCKHCGEDLMKKEEYVIHKRQCAAELAICDVCGESVPQRRQFRKHLIKHFRKRIRRSWICEKCGKELTSRHGLQRHMNSRHIEESELYYYYCHSCSKGFNNEEAYRNHMRLHNKKTVDVLEDYYVCVAKKPYVPEREFLSE